MKDRFDYEAAREDIWDMGLDPDELPEKDADRRDAYLRRNGIDPDHYKPGGGQRDSGSGRGGGYGSSGTGGCFLTSACVHAKNLPDDCEELRVLRSYRDGFMMSSEEGRAEVRQYYADAPGIVAAINKSPDAETVWENLFSSVIVPAAAHIKAGRMEEAHRLYRSCVLRLRERYIGPSQCYSQHT